MPDGTAVKGKVHDIVSDEDKAHIVLGAPDGQHSITEIPLTPTETAAARAFGDAVFGKPQKRQRKLDDITELYGWFLEVYSKYDRDALLRQIQTIPNANGLESFRWTKCGSVLPEK